MFICSFGRTPDSGSHEASCALIKLTFLPFLYEKYTFDSQIKKELTYHKLKLSVVSNTFGFVVEHTLTIYGYVYGNHIVKLQIRSIQFLANKNKV